MIGIFAICTLKNFPFEIKRKVLVRPFFLPFGKSICLKEREAGRQINRLGRYSWRL